MHTSAEFLLTIGCILLLGLLSTSIVHRTFLPRVTLLLIFGVLVGEQGLDLIPSTFTEGFELLANMTLVMIGFLLGGKLTGKFLREAASQVLWISVSAAIVTAVLVTIGLSLIGAPIEVAILLGCLASATDAAAVMNVVEDTDRSGKPGRLLLSIVALDDVWALIMFSLGIALVSSLSGLSNESGVLLPILRDLGGATLLGLLLGLPAALLTGRIRKGQPMLSEALAIVFICGGLALWLEVSYLIASMVMGAFIANFANHHKHPFHEIEGIEWPFMVVFFVLAGASLEIEALKGLGLLGIAYILCRSAGKYLGAIIGGKISGANARSAKWIGVALLPQAGVSIGMALVAASLFPQYQQLLLSIAISATVFFEIVGPVLTRLAIQKTTELNLESRLNLPADKQ